VFQGRFLAKKGWDEVVESCVKGCGVGAEHGQRVAACRAVLRGLGAQCGQAASVAYRNEKEAPSRAAGG